MTSNARESIGVPRDPAFPNRKHAKTETEMNDMKRLLPSLILAVSVCTGCRTGAVQPERSAAPEKTATQSPNVNIPTFDTGGMNSGFNPSLFSPVQKAPLKVPVFNSGGMNTNFNPLISPSSRQSHDDPFSSERVGDVVWTYYVRNGEASVAAHDGPAVPVSTKWSKLRQQAACRCLRKRSAT